MKKIIVKQKLLTKVMIFFVSYNLKGVTDQTTFVPRTLSNDATLELTLTNYRLFHNDYDAKPYTHPKHRAMFAIQNTYFYQETNSGRALAKYFFPNNKTELSVVQDGSGDIGSAWLDLYAADNNFNSKFSIKPKRVTFGSLLNVSIDFSNIINELWMQMLMPMVKAEHHSHFREFNQGPPGVAEDYAGNVISTIQEAFNIRELTYQKIRKHKVTAWGMDDIQLKIGYNFMYTDNYHLAGYINMLIPMGSTNTNQYIFEPWVGSTHFGLGVGLNFDYKFMKVGKHELNFMTDFKYRYVFSAAEQRLIQLANNGGWSRYLNLANANNPSGRLEGPNFLTKELMVTPRSTIDWWSAIHYKFCDLNFEIGYDLWWRDCERVTMKHPWNQYQENLGVYDIARVGTGLQTSASTANISMSNLSNSPNVAPSDGSFVRITNQDINIACAAHKSALSNKITVAFSYNSLFLKQPTLLGLGASYEFRSRNTAADQWSVFAKTSYSF